MKPLPIGCPPTVSLLGNGPRWTLLLGLHAEEYKANNPAWTIGIASPTTLRRGQDRLLSCSRSGSYRLTRLAAKYGRRISASPARRARTMTWSLCEARPSAPDLTRKSVRRAVVRPLEALLDPLALVADGLDDDGHFCTHLGPPFFGASDRRGQSPRAAGDRPRDSFSQLETTVSRPFRLIPLGRYGRSRSGGRADRRLSA